MSLEKELENARALVAKFDALDLTINSLSLHDLGFGASGGYVATFDFEETLQSESDYEYWFEAADTFPRTAKSDTAAEAVRQAIAKCETELKEFLRVNYRYTNPLENFKGA